MAIYKDEERNTWYVVLSVKDTATGKWKQKKKRGFKKKSEAKEWENNQPKEINTAEVTAAEEVREFDSLQK